MVAHVVLFGCVDVVSCCFAMMPRGIHMCLLCHCSLPFLGNGSPNQYDGVASRRVIQHFRTQATLPPDLFIHSTKRRLTLDWRWRLFTQTALHFNPMPTIHAGRFSTHIDGPFVVFLIGVRINGLLAVHKWLPTAKAMGPMLSELYANPELGFLGGFSSVYFPGVMVTQYWRSFDQLVDYAQSRNASHLPAWKAFNQNIGGDGTVGIWHETYQVPPVSMSASTPTCPASASPKPVVPTPLPPATCATPARAWPRHPHPHKTQCSFVDQLLTTTASATWYSDARHTVQRYAAVDLIEGRSCPESHPRRRRAPEIRTC